MQNVDGYLVVPYIARRTVDLPPAMVLAMQLLMGALFGILGVLFADPILAALKVMLMDLSKRSRDEAGESAEGRGREAVSSGRPAAAGRSLLDAGACSRSGAPRAPP